ncbi:MAG: hypothetical protein K0R57_411 [Paenibacillaceae bacterium]|nr:hypothetical protein [Paenibacillaceae bacterium]
MSLQTYTDKPRVAGWVIFLVFFLFPPAVLIPILIRASKHKHLSYHRAIDMKITGVWLIVFWFFLAFTLIALISEEGGDFKGPLIVSMAFLFAGIVFLYFSSSKRKELQKRYEYYLHLIHVQEIRSIEQFANMVKQHKAVVKNDLLRMMYLGMLQNGMVDEYSDQLIFLHQNNYSFDIPEISFGTQGISFGGQEISYGNQEISISINGDWELSSSQSSGFAMADSKPKKKKAPPAPAAKPQPRNVECPGCGSQITLLGGESKACPYCGNTVN